MNVLTFGEMLLRLTTDPAVRLQQTNQFDFYYGGAEANVAVSLANLGIESKYVTKVPNNQIGQACARYLQSNRVDATSVLYGGDRLGIYFVEAGIGNRSSEVVYDRKFSSFANLQVTEIDWDRLLEDVDLFHTTGITLALSEELRHITKEAMQVARSKGVKISFDFNYRSKLWSQEEASVAIQDVLPFVDIAFCNDMDAKYLLNIGEQADLASYYTQIQYRYPNIELFASTTRKVGTASHHSLQGNLFMKGFLEKSAQFTINPVIDRIGGGDAYAAGILYGYLHNWSEEKMASFAIANAVLKHTIRGDGNIFSAEEVESYRVSSNKEISR
ncbi:sugar kinase [Gracilibacillus sp. S3-1-1]|uniref:Sugar kinase n=1 Tax=Gracilibacillus pellucidus TaxID=3095368 RepID=A0ACC6M2U1_9BACI|nr:sugar kinase [Gracilibacillus sp. S3-1-1]MDX8045167.1 sugar kinase [Gracilibacillus sp. S3-1-1]